MTLLQSHSRSQEQSETRQTVSKLQEENLRPSIVTPCESCYSVGTHQIHHYMSQRYHHPRQAQNHPQELMVARQVGMTQSKSHS